MENQFKLTLAVIFGGASSEHDVSVVTAQQLMDAIDPRRYDLIPVYMDFENRFWTGPNLRNTASFNPKPSGLKSVSFDWTDIGPTVLIENQLPQRVDSILPAMHGQFGEDGRVQAYFELIGIPVTGFNAVNSVLAMRKDVTKLIVKQAKVPTLPHILISRSMAIDNNQIIENIKTSFGFPVIVKPTNLGSSIGVGAANSGDELSGLIEFVLQQDTHALIEPRVPNLVEYNIAVRNVDGEIMLSAVEQPLSSADLLDFKEKYLSDSGGTKGEFKPSEGMLSLTRTINPVLSKDLTNRLNSYAKAAFLELGARGAPRIDFLCDSTTQELWFNEINPTPGSYGFFLWERASEAILYPELIDHLVQESLRTSLKTFEDPVPEGAYLLRRK